MPTSGADDPLLVVSGLSAGYGSLRVLHDVTLSVQPEEVVALVGPNGAGKSTLLWALSGLIPSSAGLIMFGGMDITTRSTGSRMRDGLVHVLEGHRVIPSLTVEDNLLLAALQLRPQERRIRLEQAFGAFPELADKRGLQASTLSGGQQQILVVAQGIVRRPRLLLLDEPSAGLSPVLFDRVLQVVSGLSREGTAVLLVEQAVEKALRVASTVYALAHGTIVLRADAAAAREPGVLERAYLGA